MNAVWCLLAVRQEYNLSNNVSLVYIRPRHLALKSSPPTHHHHHQTNKQSIQSKPIHTNTSQAITITTTFTHSTKQHLTTNTMAVFSMISNERPMLYGRSGYNSKPNGDDEDKNHGRSGYNSKPNGDDDDKNHGRSGYNSKPDDDDKDNKRSLNFA